MDFADRIQELAARVGKQLAHIQTEEATKNALVMPFIAALGYNVFDPTEVTPELNADVGIKKGEKVDYAILKDGQPVILFECKHYKADLAKEHASQLYRYFSVTAARFGVLTNGLSYWFYTDLEAPNKMDSRPFFEFNLMDLREQDMEELKKFSKNSFNVEGIISAAGELKFTRDIKRILAEQMQAPSEEFIKFFAAQIYPTRMNQAVKAQFTTAVQRAMRQFISEQVNDRLKTALAGDLSQAPAAEPLTQEQATKAEEDGQVITTQNEMEAFYIVRAILREIVDVKRVIMRDVQRYCGILLDDNNRKPVCRFYFNTSQWYLSFFDNPERKEAKVQIASLEDIYKYADRLRATVGYYLPAKQPVP